LRRLWRRRNRFLSPAGNHAPSARRELHQLDGVNVIVRSRVSEINFDVYFFDCTDNRCGAIQFAAGWSNSSASEARINEWNTTKRYLRVYSKPGKAIWAEQDVLVTRSTTENLDDCLALWPKMIVQFKTFMKL
jgi:hypothetical protein